MNTRSVTISHDAISEVMKFNSADDLIQMIKDLDIDEHSGSFIVEGISGNYVFWKMDTDTLLEHIKTIDMWKTNELQS
jgi:hypothetical protein